MKDISKMTKSELISYFKELQPCLRWDLNQMTEYELKECIMMHFSNK